MRTPTPSLTLEAITHRIFVLREQKVLLDSGLAERLAERDKMLVATKSLGLNHVYDSNIRP